MNRTELISVLDELGVHPSRRLGQNFLADPNLLAAIVRTAAPQPGEHILEIGPGLGALTGKLLQAGAAVTAVEYDHRLVAYLRRRFAGCANLRLLAADACALDFDQVMGGQEFRCISNLPYAISSVLVAEFLGLRRPPPEMHLLLQLEMADRLAAAPGSKQYGALSVQVQLCYDVQVLRKVPPEVFFPAPEVASAFVHLRQSSDVARPHSPERVSRVRETVRLGFSQRRKQLLKLLSARYGESRTREAFADVGIAESARAEELMPAQFAELAEILTR